MFSVLFEVNPHPAQWDAYLGYAKMLRPELEQIEGFVDNIRYRSLTRPGWILSLSNWRDEKSLVRWRTRARHHDIQERGRADVFAGYRLRVGQVTADTHVPGGYTLTEQRLDETETGQAKAVTLTDTARDPAWVTSVTAEEAAEVLGLGHADAGGLVAWDVYDAVLIPGHVILTMSWLTQADAAAAVQCDAPAADTRHRVIRVIRDYGKHDRRESPQYYPDVP